MESNALKELHQQGQSIWLDNIQRSMITSGKLQEMIDGGLMGMTSNPTIFEKAIAGSADYDQDVKKLLSEGKDVDEILNALTIKDIQMAADLFLPVYEKSGGEDGFVSIEVNPNLAYQTEETIQNVKDLHQRVQRKNVMIKVPATPQGIPAIETLIAEGISINVTLIFSIEAYQNVAKAYIAGLQKLAEKGKSLSLVRSVASVFVSRIDTAVDKMLEARIKETSDTEARSVSKTLLGKTAVANTKLIYRQFKEIFSGKAFLELQAKGAHVQRPLWGSTGTKNPNYSDLLYVEELVGTDTVNTAPPATLSAIQDHAKVRPSLEEAIEEARETVSKLSRLGIDLTQVTDKLLEDGVKSFAGSFQGLTEVIEKKVKAL